MTPEKFRAVLAKVTPASEDMNERGNHVRRYSYFGADRYYFDFQLCMPADGWQQFDTDQDAWYFGVWVHRAARMTVTYAEGDLTIVDCPTVETFNAEITDACGFYGEGFVAKAIGPDGITVYCQDRREFYILAETAA